jgi:hypothetical protein
MNNQAKPIDNAYNLIRQLERLSADSTWAHRASGIRGSLIKFLDQYESSGSPEMTPSSLQHLKELNSQAFNILKKAARDIQGLD